MILLSITIFIFTELQAIFHFIIIISVRARVQQYSYVLSTHIASITIPVPLTLNIANS